MGAAHLEGTEEDIQPTQAGCPDHTGWHTNHQRIPTKLRTIETLMANPEELRKRDQELPKRKRKYPQSRVTQALVILLVIVVVAWLVSLI